MQPTQQAMLSIYQGSWHNLNKITKMTLFILIMPLFLMTTPSALLNLLGKMQTSR
jgi:hypothetical protein